MTEEIVLQVGREALYLIVYLAAPLLLSALLAGMVIGVFQAATQIQEQTLSFIPKLGALVVALLLLGPWLLQMLLNFTENLFISIPGMIG